MPDIKYPYLPAGRTFKFVPIDNPFMQAAKQAAETLAGDPIHPVGIVLVKDGKVVMNAGNGFCLGAQVHICPRIVLECPSGTGYDLCSLHESPGHSEPMLMKRALEAGIDPKGGDAYMYGHWWACEPCWKALIDHDVRDVYLVENAHELFTREAVYLRALTPDTKSVYISGGLTNLPAEIKEGQKKFYENLGAAAEELGIKAYVPHLHSDPEKHAHYSPREVYDMDVAKVREMDAIIAEVTYPALGVGGELDVAHAAGKPIILVSKKGSKVTRYTRGIPSVVYHVEYEDEATALKHVKNVLKQL